MAEARSLGKPNRSTFSNPFSLGIYSSEIFKRSSLLMDFVLDFNIPFQFLNALKKAEILGSNGDPITF
jgi:hypothetical protein